MAPYYGDFAEDDTVNIPFNTFDSNDPSASVTITNLADSDIHVHKDGSITQIVTDGATVVLNFDGITGNHMITIDTSVHADYSTGSEYAVRIEGTTIDAATINAWVGAFSIERAGGALALIKLITASGPTKAEMDTAHGLLATEAKQDIIDTEVDKIVVGTITNATGADVATDIVAVKAETVLIVADTNELQTDWANGGRLDLIIDAILVDTAEIGAAGAGLTAIPATVDWLNGGRLDLILDAILVDTAEIGAAGAGLTAIPATVDWLDGGRLDLLLDAIKAITDQFVFTVANLVDSNMLAISGDTGAADALEALMDGVQEFTVNDASATTTAFAADGFTATAVDDVYKGRLITFLTGANVFEQTDITGYDHTGGAQGEQEFTVTALTAAPANNVIGIIH